MLYAVTDIETTGSHASGSSIIEIAVILFDGEQVVAEFSSLIDPGVHIPSYITALTGIHAEMLQGAPTFSQVADQLEELFEGAVFVAHNVGFDHSFIKAEFGSIGRVWNPQRLCSMRMARKAFPGQKSYGLNAICRWMGIVNARAHRALSDAHVATEVLRRSLQLVPITDVKKMIARNNGLVFLPPNLPEHVFAGLPESPGVYYLYNEKGKPLYIGKARNIKKRIKQHFTVNTEGSRTQQFLREVTDIGFELTGNELIALLLEDAEIRKHWPEHNKAQKRKTYRTSVISYDDHSGFRRLAFQSGGNQVGAIKTFASVSAARKWLHALASEFALDERLLGLTMFDTSRAAVSAQAHNEALDHALREFLMRDPSYVIAASGRREGEIGYVVVERGRLQGYAFTEYAITNPDELLFHIKPLSHSENTSAILDQFEKASWGYRRIDIALEPAG